ncbi:hypothetical protein YYC_05839 [Plasmodium yoelii 17X]|uniref:YIR protein n=1 Tax=Plasmodium yoelii 17X TaxID=1323249 RepID=V7PBL1_PLAYE|nr:hypothetical protein YYC_05839 [Plasmodium yoelii 17X]
MDKEVCKRFKNVWDNFPDILNNEDYQIKDDKNFKTYCTDNCGTYIDKINAGCLFLLNAFFGSSDSFNSVAKSNIDIVEYIIIWLSYMLNLKGNADNNISNLNHFYTAYINGSEKYKNFITGVEGYSSYKDLLNQKTYFLNMNNSIISNFYKAFKLLCEMYTEFDENNQDCAKNSEKAEEFVKKYEELNGNSGITNNSSFNQLLSTLLNDYDNLKNKCKGSSFLPAIKSTQITSNPSIVSKLIPVLLIFGAIAFLGGIAYKYSLFGFRKRFKKQQIREKIKNIKKRMNH